MLEWRLSGIWGWRGRRYMSTGENEPMYLGQNAIVDGLALMWSVRSTMTWLSASCVTAKMTCCRALERRKQPAHAQGLGPKMLANVAHNGQYLPRLTLSRTTLHHCRRFTRGFRDFNSGPGQLPEEGERQQHKVVVVVFDSSSCSASIFRVSLLAIEPADQMSRD